MLFIKNLPPATEYTAVRGKTGWRVHWVSEHDSGVIPHRPAATADGAWLEAVRYLHERLEDVHDILHEVTCADAGDDDD